jgi:glycosyltransferase involved in cell wall biosynthesis
MPGRLCATGQGVPRSVTPFILTYNEEPNLGRTLESLRWAARVVVVDSGSTDATRAIAERFSNVAWFERRFDDFEGQSRFAVEETGIDAEYVLALDADMAVPAPFVAELEARFFPGDYAGALLPFEYWVLGRPLLGSILRPQLRLFRREAVRIQQIGHGHKFAVDGPVYRFKAPILHDDRKSLDRWTFSQLGYSKKELDRMAHEPPSWKDRVRRSGLMPLIAGSVTYLRAGGPFGGRAALHYTYERVVFESLMAMRLLGEEPPDERE